MGKYDTVATINTAPTSGSNGSGIEKKAKAWGNIRHRLKDGASVVKGIPYMESDYVDRSIIHALMKIEDEAERNRVYKQLLIKAIENSDVEFRIVTERDKSAVGELDL